MVVTNHALLFRNAAADGGILPPIRYWLVDEAHNVETEARKQLARHLDSRDMTTLLHQLGKARSSVPERLLRAAREQEYTQAQYERTEEAVRTLQAATARATDLTESFFALAVDLDEHRRTLEAGDGPVAGPDRRPVWINEQLRTAAVWGTLTHTGTTLYSALKECEEAGRQLAAAVSAGSGPGSGSGETLPSEQLDLSGLLFTVTDMAETLAVIVSEPEDKLVYSLTVSPTRHGSLLTVFEVQELDVGGPIAENLLAEATSISFTSATLAVGDSFERFAAGIGLDRDPPWESLRLTSSYDLSAQMRIFVPLDLPDPRARGYRAAFGELLQSAHSILGGGILTLFTNREEMRACYKDLSEPLAHHGIELLVQSGALSTKTLQERFIADPRASLFAVKSFWEGFDARGDTLRCVIIAKLPFQPPGDPLSRERELRDRSAWGRYCLPDAILELKQAVGRLIRSSTDHGCVILADSRIATKNYGRRIRASMPVPVELLSVSELLSELHEEA
jgi:ATP-dependent DNA helicase DinG